MFDVWLKGEFRCTFLFTFCNSNIYAVSSNEKAKNERMKRVDMMATFDHLFNIHLFDRFLLHLFFLNFVLYAIWYGISSEFKWNETKTWTNKIWIARLKFQSPKNKKQYKEKNRKWWGEMRFVFDPSFSVHSTHHKHVPHSRWLNETWHLWPFLNRFSFPFYLKMIRIRCAK